MKKIFPFLLSLLVAVASSAQKATGDNTSPEDFAAILKTADRASRDLVDLPPSFSLKKFAPIPQNQGDYGTCVAWSSAYAARTISYALQRNMTNADSIKKYVFSPGYIYYKIKDSADKDCTKGSSILNAMKTMSSTGIMLKKEGLIDCTITVPKNTEQKKATPYKIKDFLSLNTTYGAIAKNDILKIKKSLTEKKPVVISIKCYNSFKYVTSPGIWTPLAEEGIPESHAVCIIGFDDNINGGSFEIMNSWGTEWGDQGFGWLSYAQAMKYGNYAVEMMDIEPGKTELSGNMEFINLEGTAMPATKSKTTAYNLYKLTDTLATRSAFKMKFSTNSPCYIYVFAQDSKGDISPLFPPKSTISAAINSPNATYYFPSDSTNARLRASAGKEIFCILYSKSSVDYEGIMNYMKATNTSITKAVNDKLTTRLLDMKKVRFRDDRILFQSPAVDNSVLCFFIEMNHW